MKFFTIMIFSLTCLNAHADCQDEWLRYESPKQWLSVAYSEGCYQGDLILSAEKKVPGWPDKIGPSITTNFDKECPLTKQDKKGEMIEFSCRKDGISPLAGATYRFKITKTTIQCDGVAELDWDIAFICINNCGPTTPKKLSVLHGEGCA